MHLTTCSWAGEVWLPRLTSVFHHYLFLPPIANKIPENTHLSVAAAQPLEKPFLTTLTRFSTRYQTITHAATLLNLDLLFEYFL